MATLLNAAIGLLPILVFLGVLMVLDSYKLVRPAALVMAIVAGALAATICYGLNTLLFELLGMEFHRYSVFVAPWIEECMKFAYLAWLLRTGRVGFMVDAAILGFAIGAGFGMLENVYYLQAVEGARLLMWLIRGFGTGIMHGGAVAVAAIVAKMLAERAERVRITHLLPGFVFAVLMHAGFNALYKDPMIATLLVVLIMPFVTMAAFSLSEKYLRSWLDLGFNTDTDLLRIITAGGLAESRVGRYIQSIRSGFPPEVLADMLCYLKVFTELSIRAKGLLLLKEMGMTIPGDEGVREKFSELRYLRKSIGRSGLLTLSAILRHSPRDLWQLNFLESEQ